MKTVFFDVDTQIDFMFPSGALYAPGAERIANRVAALNQQAAQTGSVVVSTMDAHTEDDREFERWPGHCIVGTFGQRKPENTLLSKRLVIPPVEVDERIDGFEQIILQKRSLDCFVNPNLPWLIEAFGADRYVVYGLVTEYCVKYAAWGLLAAGKRVEVVSDAIRSLNEQDGNSMLDEFRGRGGVLIEASSIVT